MLSDKKICGLLDKYPYPPKSTMVDLLGLCRREAEAPDKQLAVVSSCRERLMVDRLGRTTLSYIGHWSPQVTWLFGPSILSERVHGFGMLVESRTKGFVGWDWSEACELEQAGRVRACAEEGLSFNGCHNAFAKVCAAWN